MPDVFTVEKRRAIMSAIHAENTHPEKVVQDIVRRLGYRRFRVHVRTLPGNPDLAFKGLQKIIFVNGCYWHRHVCKKGRSVPQTRTAFWQEKFEANRRRDKAVRRTLRRMGWTVLTVWECQTKKTKINRLTIRLARFLSEEDPATK